MALRKAKPTSPGRRFAVQVTDAQLHRGEPYGPLVRKLSKSGGRNNQGRTTTRHRGGGHKRRYRVIDFRRDKDGVAGKVERLEYDPNRSANIALILYRDGERRYIIAPRGIKAGQEVASGTAAPIKPGNALPLRNIPVGTQVHCVEMRPGKGAQLGRSAGAALQLVGELKRRSYSIATVPADPEFPGETEHFRNIEMAVSYIDGGLATERLSRLQPGERLLASGPYGRFCLHEDHPKRYLLIATGTGVTPYRSMLPEIARRMAQEGTRFVLIFGVRTPEELLYGEEFADFAHRHPGFTFHPCFSRADPTRLKGDDRAGYVQYLFDEVRPDPESDLVYLCGNPDMIDDAVARLEPLGFGHRQVKREKYLAGR